MCTTLTSHISVNYLCPQTTPQVGLAIALTRPTILSDWGLSRNYR